MFAFYTIEASFLQLVILGCGMDTRALRLKFETEKDNVKIYELDLPHVIDYKQNLLESIGAITPDVAKRRVVISADLSQFEVRMVLFLHTVDCSTHASVAMA